VENSSTRKQDYSIHGEVVLCRPIQQLYEEEGIQQDEGFSLRSLSDWPCAPRRISNISPSTHQDDQVTIPYPRFAEQIVRSSEETTRKHVLPVNAGRKNEP
jgi:hypothetical protein